MTPLVASSGDGELLIAAGALYILVLLIGAFIVERRHGK